MNWILLLPQDGDYNCDIPAQRSSKLNKWKPPHLASLNGSVNGSMNGSLYGRTPPINGLCEPCNRNQELKVQQLASFEPENEHYFDEEIEEYRYVSQFEYIHTQHGNNSCSSPFQ